MDDDTASAKIQGFIPVIHTQVDAVAYNGATCIIRYGFAVPFNV